MEIEESEFYIPSENIESYIEEIPIFQYCSNCGKRMTKYRLMYGYYFCKCQNEFIPREPVIISTG